MLQPFMFMLYKPQLLTYNAADCNAGCCCQGPDCSGFWGRSTEGVFERGTVFNLIIEY